MECGCVRFGVQSCVTSLLPSPWVLCLPDRPANSLCSAKSLSNWERRGGLQAEHHHVRDPIALRLYFLESRNLSRVHYDPRLVV